MDSSQLASGDCNVTQPVSARYFGVESSDEPGDIGSPSKLETEPIMDEKPELNDVTPKIIDDNETKLKDRIAECRNIIESLKLELNEEKAKLEKQHKTPRNPVECIPKCVSSNAPNSSLVTDYSEYNMYTDSVDSKLICDEGLIEYERQLQKYQNTLNLAQMEKKNAIRKHMLAKAYRLKLLEVENQCNIELLRVKQSLQCLEPLQHIANKWKTSTSEVKYDYFDLNPRYPDSNMNCAENSYELDFKPPPEKIEGVNDDSAKLG